MQRVLGDGDALRLQRRVELLDAEHPTGGAQQVTHEPAQRRHVAHVVALDHVAQHRHVDVVAQKLIPRRRVEPLRLGKAAGPEPVEEGAFEPRPFPGRQDGCIVRKRPSPVAERLAEAERVNQHLPPAAPKGRSDLSRQERGGRAGDDHLGAFGIEEPADETLPAGDDLDFVEVPDHRRDVIHIREFPAVLGHKQVEVGGVEVRKPLVLERDVRQPLPSDTLLDALLPELVQERGLAGPAHPHHRRRLAGKPYPAEDVARRERGQRLAERVGELLSERLPQARVLRVHRRLPFSQGEVSVIVSV